MNKRKILPIIALFALLLTGASCTSPFGGHEGGGVYKSLDAGTTWVSKASSLSKDGKKGSIDDLDISTIKIDAKKATRVFIGTVNAGLFVSENGGESWTSILPGIQVVDLALDASSQCVVYALSPYQLYKTTDCAKTWNIVFNESRPGSVLTSIETDQIQPEIIYITTTEGDILKSFDRGTKWTAVYRFPDTQLTNLAIDRWDSNLLYLSTKRKGLFKSPNKGVNWFNISESFSERFSTPDVTIMTPLSQKAGLIIATEKGLMKTYNAGDSWQELALISAEGQDTILALAPNPVNDQEIYYATTRSIFHTTNGGGTWSSRPLPSSRAASFMAIDPRNTNYVYMGTQNYKKSSPFF